MNPQTDIRPHLLLLTNLLYKTTLENLTLPQLHILIQLAANHTPTTAHTLRTQTNRSQPQIKDTLRTLIRHYLITPITAPGLKTTYYHLTPRAHTIITNLLTK